MRLRAPSSTRTDTHFPYTTLFRSDVRQRLRESISPTIHRLAPSTRNGPAALALMPEPFYSRRVPDPTYLSSQLLLALPGIGDPRFERAVIAMCVIDENGELGIGIDSEVERKGDG